MRSADATLIGATPMNSTTSSLAARSFLAVSLLSIVTALPIVACAHENHEHFSAGEPGDPKKPARTIKVEMQEDGKKMLFKPARIEVRQGEQIHFVLFNNGTEDHEFILATVAENRKHGELMKKFPKMEHDDPNGKRLSPYAGGDLFWRFTKQGEFEFACLIPDHYESGMHGTIIVK
jgi:uncharacterized cupredoxin-like copper-binding protein